MVSSGGLCHEESLRIRVCFTDSKLYPYSGIRKNQKLDIYKKRRVLTL